MSIATTSSKASSRAVVWRPVPAPISRTRAVLGRPRTRNSPRRPFRILPAAEAQPCSAWRTATSVAPCRISRINSFDELRLHGILRLPAFEIARHVAARAGNSRMSSYGFVSPWAKASSTLNGVEIPSPTREWIE